MKSFLLGFFLFYQSAFAAMPFFSRDIGANVWVDYNNSVGYTKYKLVWGVDAAAVDVSLSNPWPIQGTVTSIQGTFPWVDNITQFGGSNVVTGTGISGLGIPRVTVSNDSNILATQSGTWTVQQGSTPTTVGNAWPIKLTDGTNTTAVKAASTAAIATDPSAVIALSPNSPVPTGTNIIGAVTTGIVQTTAPSPKTTGTATQNVTDEYSRQTIVSPEAINAEWGQMFSASSNTAALTGTTETAFFYFKNPNGSGKSAKIFQVILGPTLGNNYVTYRFYTDPTVSVDGTTVTPVGNRQTGQNSTVLNVFRIPTVSANGSLFWTFIASGLAGLTGTINFNFDFWIEENHSLLITRQLSANATIGGVSITWVEQ